MNYRRVLYVVGLLITTVSATMAAPLAIALLFDETDAAKAFATALGSGIVAGVAAIIFGTKPRDTFHRREGLTVVGLAWVVCALFGCIPYMMTGTIPEFVGAYFETMSGFTTTGASVLESIDLDAAGEPRPRSILFWRCMTNWLGGVGIVVLFVALLPALGVGGRLIFHFEVPGVGEKGFMPHIRQTALTLWGIYLLLTGVQFGLLTAFGMDWFNAICHSFATLATGGFSPHDSSVGHYSSTAIHIVITAFMFLAGINFTLYFNVIRGRWKTMFRDAEFRIYAGVVLLATGVVTAELVLRGAQEDAGLALRDSAFQVVSISTTTGFGTADFDGWPALSRLVLVMLMFVGGCAGSTAGGMKMVRIALLVKYVLRQVKQHIRPRNVGQVRFGSEAVSHDVLRPVVGMFILFMLTYAAGTLALAALGLDLTTSATASIAALGNIGPGLGSVGPTGNFAHIPETGKVLLTILMLIGRLEIYTALSLFAPMLWRD